MQILEAQLKRFDNYGNFVLETWTQLESFASFASLLLEPWKGLEGFDNYENSKK